MPKPPGYIVLVDKGTEYEADIDVLRDSYGTPVLFAEREDASPWTDSEVPGITYKIESLVRYRKPRTKKEKVSQ